MKEQRKEQVSASPKRRSMSRLVLLGMALASLMCVPAFASGGSGGGELATVTGAIPAVGDLMDGVITMITGNPILVVFFAVPLIGVGVGVFRMIKSAAKR